MAGIVENINGVNPPNIAEYDESIILHKKCYSCNPRGTLKDHIISQSNDFVFWVKEDDTKKPETN